MIENQRQLTFAFGLMLVLVFLVLASLFESYRKPFIIMASVPLAFIGAVLLLFISGKSINIGALMGLIILGGIVVNNSIVMVDHISRLSGRYKNYWRAVIKGSSDRLRPVLITSITTTLGMLPLALDRSEDSSLWSPLAITVIGGMISSTILTLFLIPCIYTLIYPDKKK
jgi:HAE1 family hydrophobic/amphiphilic exporter-1